RFTVPTNKGGRYLVGAAIQFNAAGAGAGAMTEELVVAVNATGVGILSSETITPGTTFASQNGLAGLSIVNVAAAALIHVRAFQNGGGGVGLTRAGFRNRLVIARLSS